MPQTEINSLSGDLQLLHKKKILAHESFLSKFSNETAHAYKALMKQVSSYFSEKGVKNGRFWGGNFRKKAKKHCVFNFYLYSYIYNQMKKMLNYRVFAPASWELSLAFHEAEGGQCEYSSFGVNLGSRCLQQLSKNIFYIMFYLFIMPAHSCEIVEDKALKIFINLDKIVKSVEYCKNRKGVASFNDTICLNTFLDYVVAEVFIAQSRGKAIAVVTSRGGYTLPAIRIAQALRQQDMIVVFDEYCASACANYLFLAATMKVARLETAIGWHGSVASFPSYVAEGRDEAARAFRATEIEVHDEFIAMFPAQTAKAYAALMNDPPPNYTAEEIRSGKFWSVNLRKDAARYCISNLFILADGNVSRLQ